MGKRKDEKNKERIGMKSDEEEKIGLSLYGTSKTRRRKKEKTSFEARRGKEEKRI